MCHHFLKILSSLASIMLLVFFLPCSLFSSVSCAGSFSSTHFLNVSILQVFFSWGLFLPHTICILYVILTMPTALIIMYILITLSSKSLLHLSLLSFRLTCIITTKYILCTRYYVKQFTYIPHIPLMKKTLIANPVLLTHTHTHTKQWIKPTENSNMNSSFPLLPPCHSFQCTSSRWECNSYPIVQEARHHPLHTS